MHSLGWTEPEQALVRPLSQVNDWSLKCSSLLPGTEGAGSFPHHVGTVLVFRVGLQRPIYL